MPTDILAEVGRGKVHSAGRMNLQFKSLRDGEVGLWGPFTEHPPIFLWKGVMKDEAIPTGINWKQVGERKHAFVANYDAAYKFSGSRGNLKSQDQTDVVNELVMAMIRKVRVKMGQERKESPNGAFNLIQLPHLDAASLAYYDTGAKCGTHRDDERMHTSDAIVSLTLGVESSAIMKIFDDSRRLIGGFKLHHGDVVIFDRNIFHSVDNVVGPRVNITYRAWTKEWYKATGFSKANNRPRDQSRKRNWKDTK